MMDNGAISAKAAKSYREEHVNGLSQKELILMLYDGAIKFSAEAKEAVAAGNTMDSHRLIIRARNIILELLRILNIEKGGDVAKNLQRLYVHMIGRFIEANLTNQLYPLEDVLMILQILRSAWAQIDFEKAVLTLEKFEEIEKTAPCLPAQPQKSACVISVTA